jgi:hypothetical protein
MIMKNIFIAGLLALGLVPMVGMASSFTFTPGQHYDMGATFTVQGCPRNSDSKSFTHANSTLLYASTSSDLSNLPTFEDWIKFANAKDCKISISYKGKTTTVSISDTKNWQVGDNCKVTSPFSKWKKITYDVTLYSGGSIKTKVLTCD